MRRRRGGGRLCPIPPVGIIGVGRMTECNCHTDAPRLREILRAVVEEGISIIDRKAPI